MYRDSRRLRLLFALLILTSFTLITIDYRSGEGTVLSAIRSGANAVFGPLQRAVTSVVRPIGNALSTVADLGSLREDKKRLEADNRTLRKSAREAEDAIRERDQLAALLELSARGRYTIVGGHVSGYPVGQFEWTVTIDLGTKDKVRAGMTVINGDGLVGRVLHAAPYTSTVLLAIDPQFAVGSRVAGSGETGTLRGEGRDPMVLTLTNQEARVRRGLGIVTSADSTLAAGVPIGVVSDVRRRPGDISVSVEVRPYVKYTTLDAIAVILVEPRTDPRDSVLPTPSPTPPPVTTQPSPSVTPSGSASPSPSGSP